MPAEAVTLRFRLALEWLTIGLVASAMALAISWSQTAAPLDELLYDSLSSASAPPADDRILLVTIDDHSLARLGRWPWDRTTHAQLLEVLNRMQPRSVTLDILMTEPSAVDQVLADAMHKSTAPVFLPLHFTPSELGPFGEDSATTAQLLRDSAHQIGHVNLDFDADGIVRKTSLCAKGADDVRQWPHIGELVVRGKDS